MFDGLLWNCISIYSRKNGFVIFSHLNFDTYYQNKLIVTAIQVFKW
jgi:hypothetical protein